MVQCGIFIIPPSGILNTLYQIVYNHFPAYIPSVSKPQPRGGIQPLCRASLGFLHAAHELGKLKAETSCENPNNSRPRMPASRNGLSASGAEMLASVVYRMLVARLRTLRGLLPLALFFLPWSCDSLWAKILNISGTNICRVRHCRTGGLGVEALRKSRKR